MNEWFLQTKFFASLKVFLGWHLFTLAKKPARGQIFIILDIFLSVRIVCLSVDDINESVGVLRNIASKQKYTATVSGTSLTSKFTSLTDKFTPPAS